jgi:pyruvate/2-oxoglutarate dehydrogenase complex dihydrolipoamide dehydrogenase (E3) component
MSVVGLTEQETKAQRIAYEVSVARIRETPRGQISGLRKSGVRTVIPNRAGMLAAS